MNKAFIICLIFENPNNYELVQVYTRCSTSINFYKYVRISEITDHAHSWTWNEI